MWYFFLLRFGIKTKQNSVYLFSSHFYHILFMTSYAHNTIRLWNKRVAFYIRFRAIHVTKKKEKSSINESYLFVIQTSCQCKDSGLWIQWEHIITPVRDYRIWYDGIVSNVRINCIYNTNLIATWSIFWYIKWICRFGKRRWIVIGVSYLQFRKRIFKLLKFYD